MMKSFVFIILSIVIFGLCCLISINIFVVVEKKEK